MEEIKMSNPQSMESIVSMQEQQNSQGGSEGPKDPIQAEFEEGKKFLGNGNLAQAAIAFHNVLLAHEEKGDENGIANASNQLGHVCLERGEFEKAERHYKRAWEIIEKLSDTMSMNHINGKLIQVYRGMKEHKKATNICLDLLDICRQNKDAEGTVRLLELMADIFIESGDKGAAADAYRTIASIHNNYSHKRSAEEYLQKAAELA